MESSKSPETRQMMEHHAMISCLRLGAIILAGSIFAYLVELGDFTFMLSTFLAVSGILRGTAAAIAADEIWASGISRWDEAAFLILLSLIVYWSGGLSAGVA